MSKFQKFSFRSKTFNQIQKKSATIDLKRNNKLNQLLGDVEHEKIVVHNRTDLEIPPEISEIIQFGIGHALGGKAHEMSLLREYEKLTDKWVSYARKSNISEVVIYEAKGFLSQMFSQMKTSGSSSKIAKVRQFLTNNPQTLFISCDKSKNLVFMKTDDYHVKLSEEFGNTNLYQPIKRNPLVTETNKYNKTISCIKPYISSSNYYKMKPRVKLKSGYGLIKLHRENEPLRPIISSRDTLTVGSEEFLIPFLRKITTVYSLKSTRDFKLKFCEKRDSFRETDVCASFDVTKLYPSVDVPFVIKGIVDRIYKSKGSTNYFFDHNLDDNGKVKIIPRKIFEAFLKAILCDYTVFTTSIGIFKQTSGMSMGSSISSLVANIYLKFIEEVLIDKKSAEW